MSSKDYIEIEEARQNNLKIDRLKIPLYKNIVITGVSGAGKSSLVMDTIYAESQRRFFLSLSTFARQFFEKIPSPDVKFINELQPSIAVIRKSFIKNPRSTVATITEIYDFLRILFAKKGKPYCPSCGREIIKYNPESLKKEILERFSGVKINFGFITNKNLREIYGGGFLYAMVDGKRESIFKVKSNPIYVVIDTLVVKPSEAERVFEGILTAFHWSNSFFVEEGNVIHLFSGDLFCPYCNIKIPAPDSALFSFNSSKGACPVCKGYGDIIEIDMEKVIPNSELSIKEGAIEPFEKPAAYELKEELIEFCKKEKITLNKPFKKLKDNEKKLIIEGGKGYYGVKGFFQWLETKKYKTHVRVFLSKYRKYTECPVCKGSRLNKNALSHKIEGKNLGDIIKMDIGEFKNFIEKIAEKWKEDKVIKTVISELRERANYLIKVGLEYLTLNRKTFTLSGGEAQRISLTTVLGTTLSDTMIIIEEVSRGLHIHDFKNLVEIIKELKENKNSLLMIEHSEDAMKISDEIIELGPGSGEKGGNIVFQGSFNEYERTDTFLEIKKGLAVKHEKNIRDNPEFLEVWGAKKYNINNIDFKIALKNLTSITGVSGAGKSTLLYEILYKGLKKEEINFKKIKKGEIRKVIYIDDSLPSKSTRATVGTYLKLMEPIRTFFSELPEAKTKGFKKAHFSFNRKEGQCPECKGSGFITVELQFLSDMNLLCDECNGKRFKKEVLDINYKGKNIYNVMELTLAELEEFFNIEIPVLEERLKITKDLGIDYLKLGQPISTLSGGESQRIKLSKYFSNEKVKNTLFLIDEPTVGLHPKDIQKIIKTFRKFLKMGATIVAVEHNPFFILSSNYIIDLGPEGGKKGGKLIYQGDLSGLLNNTFSLTGKMLSEIIN